MTKDDPRLRYHPLKDTLAIVFCVALILVIVLTVFFSKKSVDGTYFANIRYQNTDLWDKDDESTKEERLVPFPKEGKKVLVYKKSDGPYFLGEGKTFDFYDVGYPDKDRKEPQIEVTLYSDISIEITYQKSPRNVCENMGRVHNVYTPLVCLPNSFQVSIVSKNKEQDHLPDFDN